MKIIIIIIILLTIIFKIYTVENENNILKRFNFNYYNSDDIKIKIFIKDSKAMKTGGILLTSASIIMLATTEVLFVVAITSITGKYISYNYNESEKKIFSPTSFEFIFFYIASGLLLLGIVGVIIGIKLIIRATSRLKSFKKKIRNKIFIFGPFKLFYKNNNLDLYFSLKF